LRAESVLDSGSKVKWLPPISHYTCSDARMHAGMHNFNFIMMISWSQTIALQSSFGILIFPISCYIWSYICGTKLFLSQIGLKSVFTKYILSAQISVHQHTNRLYPIGDYQRLKLSKSKQLLSILELVL